MRINAGDVLITANFYLHPQYEHRPNGEKPEKKSKSKKVKKDKESDAEEEPSKSPKTESGTPSTTKRKQANKEEVQTLLEEDVNYNAERKG